ncbi:late embryogenesis abundant protein [Striga asiatica]|uniref:Late embryogenesis abundant protein n=1 Tax=Striga asiatica TaxID=4170 RepID=A0A5A7RDK6_STRAF|nr:late embryogenesis abundant protein [Striga asiatica]
MLHRLSTRLQKLLRRPYFQISPQIKSQFITKSLATFSNQFSPHKKLKKAPNSYSPAGIYALKYFQQSKQYCVEIDKEVDKINLKFAEAREEIESAMDSKETVYFNEEAECARVAVSEVLELYEGLLSKLAESERAAIQRAMGLKIEQLKAELKQLDE